MTLPRKTKNTEASFQVSKVVVAIFIILTLVLVIVQFQVSSSYEIIAKKIGVYDRQSKAVNITYLDYEEQSAIMRSSNFLISEKGQDFVASPSKVIYMDPISHNTVISQR